MRKDLRSPPKDRIIRDQRKRKSIPTAPVQCPTSPPFYQLPSSTKRSSTNILHGSAVSSSNNIQLPAIRNNSCCQPNASVPSKHFCVGPTSAAGEPVGWTGSSGKTGPRATSSSRGSSAVPRSASVQPILSINSKKKKTRRGKRPSDMYRNSLNKPDKTWSILHTNIRGFSSKKISMKNIIQRFQPNVITMNEVGLRQNKKCQFLVMNAIREIGKIMNIWVELLLPL